MAVDGGGPVPGRGILVAGLFLSIFGVAFEMIGIATALPVVMELFGAQDLYAWAFSTFVIGQLLATIISGRVSDRLGPAAPMVAGFVLLMVGLLAATVAPDVWWLFLARFLQGLGAGGLTLSLYVTIALAFEGPERASVLGWVSFVWLLPAFVGPPMAAWLVGVSWRWVFAFMIPFLFAAALLVWRPMGRVQARFRPAGGRAPVHWPAVAAVSLAPAFVQLAGEGLGILSVVLGVAGVAGLVWGLGHVMPPSIRLAGRGLGAVVSARALQAGAFFASEAFMLLLLRDLHGLEPMEAGLVLTIGSVGWTGGAWLQSRAWIRLRRDQLITAGTGLVICGLATIVAFVGLGLPVAVALSGWVLGGLGMGVQLPSTAVAVMDLSGAHEQGVNNSALQVAEGLGNALMTGLAGAIYAFVLRSGSAESSFLVLFATLLGVSFVGLWVTRRIGPIENQSLRRA